jgi:hypothetical protein
LDGLAIHHVRYARAFADIGLLEEARAVMLQIENVRGEPYENQTALDNSAPDRAILWLASANPGGHSAGGTNCPREWGASMKSSICSQRLVRHLRRWAPNRRSEPTMTFFSGQTSIVGFTSLLGFPRSVTPTGCATDYPHSDVPAYYKQLQSSLERIDDPHQKSRGHAAVAIRFFNEGVPRIGLANAERALPADQMRRALAKAVELYPIAK